MMARSITYSTMSSDDYNFDPNYFMKMANLEEFNVEGDGKIKDLSFDINEEDLLVIRGEASFDFIILLPSLSLL